MSGAERKNVKPARFVLPLLYYVYLFGCTKTGRKKSEKCWKSRFEFFVWERNLRRDGFLMGFIFDGFLS